MPYYVRQAINKMDSSSDTELASVNPAKHVFDVENVLPDLKAERKRRS